MLNNFTPQYTVFSQPVFNHFIPEAD